MSTNKTANYQLHLWEPGDDFLRAEFNENNVKLDAALKAQAEELDSALAAYKTSNDAAVANVRSELNTQMGAALNLIDQKCNLVTGSYVGSGVAGRTIELGFRPKLVILCGSFGLGGSVAVVNDGGTWYTSPNGCEAYHSAAGITDTGFILNSEIFHNYNGTTETYFAFH